MENYVSPVGGRSDTIVTRSARRLESDPRVIASALTAYRARMGLGETELAALLEISTARLHSLALCNKPDPRDPHYEADLLTIARYIDCSAARLRLILDAERRLDQG